MGGWRSWRTQVAVSTGPSGAPTGQTRSPPPATRPMSWDKSGLSRSARLQRGLSSEQSCEQGTGRREEGLRKEGAREEGGRRAGEDTGQPESASTAARDQARRRAEAAPLQRSRLHQAWPQTPTGAGPQRRGQALTVSAAPSPPASPGAHGWPQSWSLGASWWEARRAAEMVPGPAGHS